ncbi:pre-peptidase C-terminal domain-containing protein [Pseudanabaena sp. FACHB-1998]|uniref:pre-peptidase C-terminal domain-containing protein n=1 Tax=Pseudanabaena sp. FACHB-1998 TaxID=2692858 RepID=UPI001680C630|nr:pre-peptidase C-terminal domain-containing protein [Pseudanabaena sp. FACHB-1998]MBD2178768.1 pre-peptidase C-terminal domain-containing protein [Pseudanabaena sp. FACHB-1998]
MLENQNAGYAFGMSGGVDTSTFGTNPLPDVFGIVKAKLQQAASNPDLFSQVFGDKANTSELQSVIKQWAIGDFSQLPSVQVISADITKGAFGLYAHDTQTVYLSDILFQSNAAPTNSLFGAVGVLVEETFHWLDDRVGTDTQGDEGELGRNLLFNSNLSSAELTRIKSEDDSGIIVLNGQSLAIEKNDTLATADNLGILNSVCIGRSGWVGTYREWWGNNWVPNDYYRFQLTNPAMLDLRLMNLENDVDLYLLNSNGNIIQSSTNGGRSEDSIARQLGVGTYYIQVKQYTQNSGNSRYDLAINSILDYAGNDRSSARNIGTLITSDTSYIDSVGNVDKDDYYGFYLNGTRDLRLSLTGLSADADVQVLNSAGTVISESKRSGNSSESINLDNLGAGTYYARVYRYSGDTNYTLRLRAENRFDQYMANVRQIYLDVLNRDPDSGGQQGWANAMLSGWTYAQVRSGIANSQESRNNVNAAYLNVLLRNADAGGLQGYVNALANNSTLRQVYESIATSNEARSNFWTAQYYNNTDRNGSVVFAQSFGRTNTGFDRNWGYSSPSGWVSSDNFSARIFGQVSFAAGLQEIRVGADDGVRVRVNGQTIIDRLVDQAFTTNTAVFNAGNGGNFNVEIEYYERGGAAALSFSTIPVIPPDSAGNSASTARNLGTLFDNGQGRYSFTANDFIGSVDPNDFYRFSLSNRNTFNLTLNNLSADADLQLIWDRNGNGAIDSYDETFSSTSGGTSQDSISRILESGSYFVRVFQGLASVNTSYALNFLADLNWGTISGINGFGQTLTHQIGLQRVNGASTAVSSSTKTWVVIHGMDGNPNGGDINLLARAIDGYEDGDQVFALDWSSAAKSNQAIIPLPGIGASWIEVASKWAADKLTAWGISGLKINLAGHSLGAYASAEIAKRISGGVNFLIAFDPAKALPGGYASESINFSANSQWSWAFYTSSFGNSGRVTTADDSFTIEFNDDINPINPVQNHGAGMNLFASMLGQNDSVSSLFKLNRMGQRPWMLDQFDEFGIRGNPLGGKYEGRIGAKWVNGRWVSQYLLYRPANAQFFDPNIKLWA